MGVYDTQVANATQKIAEKGRVVTLKRVTGFTGTSFDKVLTHSETDINVLQKSFSRYEVENGLVNEGDVKFLIDGSNEILNSDKIIDNSIEYSVAMIARTVKPGEQLILQEVHCRR